MSKWIPTDSKRICDKPVAGGKRASHVAPKQGIPIVGISSSLSFNDCTRFYPKSGKAKPEKVINKYKDGRQHMPTLDASWHAWLAENTRLGNSPESMMAAMVRAGFDYTTASANVMAYRNGGNPAAATAGFNSSLANGSMAQNASLPQYIYDPWSLDKGDIIVAHDREVRVLSRCERPQIVVMDGVLSSEECDEIIESTRERLKRSATVDGSTGQEVVIADRTSEGFSYQRGETSLCQTIERRLAAIANGPIENGEGLQILHYHLEGHYKLHYDYFPPENPGSAMQMQYGGQRIATIIMYLNDVEEGGETVFPKARFSVTPRKGSAVYFRYFNRFGQIDPLSLHGGAPVRKGEKWIMTKWLRQGMY